jgi:hypothetical protein
MNGLLTPLQGLNVLFFCDGHVSLVKATEATATNAVAMGKWNRDNEPHPETW